METFHFVIRSAQDVPQGALILTEDTHARTVAFSKPSTAYDTFRQRGRYAKAGATNTGGAWRTALNEAIARRL